jgi:hypothetical protein
VRLKVLPLFLLLLASRFPAARGDAPVSFKADIAPLLNRRCATCHNEETPKGRYRLDSFARLLKPGESDEKPVVAGKPKDSQLYQLLIEPDPHDRMPQKADPLPEAEVGLIERWIKEGAGFDGGTPERPLVEMARETFLHPAPEHYGRAVPVTGLAFSPDGTQLATSGYAEVLIWNAADGSLIRRIGGMPERISALAWDRKANRIAVAGGTPSQWGTVALADPLGQMPVRILCDMPETGLAVAFSPDGKTLAAGGGDRTIRLFDVATGKQTHVFRQHADWVQSVVFSPDGTKLLSASRDRTARILNAQSGDIETTYTGHDAPLLQAIFTGKTGDEVLSLAAHSKEIHHWTVAKPTKPKLMKSETEISQFVRNNWALVLSHPQKTVEIEQLSDEKTIFTLLGHRDTVESMAVDASGNLATGGYDGTVLLWELGCGTWKERFIARP